MGKPLSAGAPAPELQLSLSHLSAPRVSRHPDTRDEPWGWPSREHLRRLLVGRVVRFRVDYRVERISRSFATLWLQAPGGGDEVGAPSVNVRCAAAGWARLPASVEAAKAASGGSLSPEWDALAAGAAGAAAVGAGLHDATPGAGEASVRSVTWSVSPADAGAIASSLAQVGPLPAVVEQVINGGLLRVLMPGAAPSAFLALTLALAGVQCPKAPAAAPAAAAAPAPAPAPASGPVSAAAKLVRTPATAPAGGPAAAPHPEAALGAEARAFTESRLLGREVRVLITGADRPAAAGGLPPTNATFFARVELEGAGDIAMELLKAGE